MMISEKISVSDRQMAGRLLSKKLDQYANSNTIVLGIPRGGIVVAASVAEALGLSLSVLPCRKLVHPGDSERSIGSVSIEDVVLGEDCHDIPSDYIAHQIILVRNSLRHELAKYNEELVPISVREKLVIVVDDLSRSGDTMLACLRSIKKQRPLKLIVAVPFMSSKAARLAEALADEVVFLRMDHEFKASTDYYKEFREVTIDDVRNILRQMNQEVGVFQS